MSHNAQRGIRAARPAAKGWSRLGFRLLAVVIGLLPIAGLEIAAGLFGGAVQQAAVDPFVDLHQLKPLFELDADNGHYAIGGSRMNLFRPQSFAKLKPANGFRVFALGGSTTQGEPFSTETAFGKWLELHLQAMLPSREVEVVNCGGLSYASYRVNAILTEVLEYEPDLIVVYTGQNEYLEKRSYANSSSTNWFSQAGGWLARNSSLVQVLRGVLQGEAKRPEPGQRSKTQMAAEVEALLDYQGGLDDYRRGETWYAGVVEQFRWNVGTMKQQCDRAGVPVLFVLPVTNILDCPPMKFELSPTLSEGQRETFSQLWEGARREAVEGRLAQAAETLEKALAIDPQHAGAQYLLGRMHYEMGDYVLADQYLSAARDFDVCPLRATTAITKAYIEVLWARDAVFVDADQIFRDASPQGLVGQQWLVDHIHPRLEGHQLLAEHIARELVASGLVAAQEADWIAEYDRLAAQHLASLGEDYFIRGQQRLEGLILWTQGRAKKIRPDAKQQP